MRPDAVFRLQRPHARWSCDVFRKCVCPSAEMGVSGFVLPQSWNSHGNKIFRTQLERGNWQQRLLQSTDGGRSICGSRTVVIETERTPCASSLTLDLIIKTCGHKKKKLGPAAEQNLRALLFFSTNFGSCLWDTESLLRPRALSAGRPQLWSENQVKLLVSRCSSRLTASRLQGLKDLVCEKRNADEFKASGASLKTNVEIKLQLFSCALL